MGRWALILLAVMVAAAVVGFLVDAVRVIAGLLFVLALAALIGQWAMKKLRRGG